MKKKEKLDSLFDAFSIVCSGMYVYVCDIEQDISRWSKSAVEYFGLPSEYMEHAQGVWNEHLHKLDREYFNESVDAIFNGTEETHSLEYRARTRNGNYVVSICQGVVVKDESGKPEYFCGAIKNHDSVSYVDAVTNLRSLYGFLDDLQSSIWQKKRQTILMIGIENFSRTNDIFGYTFGNRALRKFGSLLLASFRREGAVYRLDGTNFAVVSSKSSVERLKEIYLEIQEFCAKKYYVGSDRLTLSLCAGAVSVDSFDISADTVYSCLKFARHESKENCHGELFVFKNSIDDETRNRLARLNVIRESIVDNCQGFELYYQPIVDAETETLRGAEALIRWKNEEYGLVPPIMFVPILEQDSLFPELGKWILKEAMLAGNRIRRKYPDFIINVNLSYAQLERTDFVDTVFGLLEETGVPSKNLCLEITERCRLLDMNLLKEIFLKLRERGIRLAVDDFGTGFSSLNVLRKLPVDCVKIDRDFVLNIQTDQGDRNTVKFISDLANSFEAKVCVEGIETPEMRDVLREFRVETFQGFYYSKPLPLDEFCRKFLDESENDAR